MSKKYRVPAVAALLLLAMPFAGTASAEEGQETPAPAEAIVAVPSEAIVAVPSEAIVAVPSEDCGVGDEDNPCAGDGTGYPAAGLPKTGV